MYVRAATKGYRKGKACWEITLKNAAFKQLASGQCVLRVLNEDGSQYAMCTRTCTKLTYYQAVITTVQLNPLGTHNGFQEMAYMQLQFLEEATGTKGSQTID